MGRTPCCDKANVKKGPWSPDEDAKLKEYIEKHGTGGNWISLPQKAGLRRCGKSCRLRWLNYLRSDIKHGDFSEEEDRIICNLFTTIGSRWSVIAAQLSGRTDNDIKNYWNTKLKKKLMAINSISSSQKKSPNGKFSPNFLLPSSTNPSSSSSSSYSDHSNNFTSFPNPNGPFSTLLEPIFSANLQSPTNLNFTTKNNATPFQKLSQDQSFNHNNYHVKDDHSLLVFGGDQASSSSSVAECGSGGGRVEVEEKRRMSFVECSRVNGWNERQLDDEMWMKTTPFMDYGLEEINQLISSSSCSNVLF